MKKGTSYLITFLTGILIFFPECKKEEENIEGKVIDIEGNVYKTIKIGTQIWMAENLKTTHYNDSTSIPLIENSDSWMNSSSGGYCWYNNDSASYKRTYGALYNGYTVTAGNLCPEGWHIPEKEEWQQLLEFLGDSTIAGGKIKEAGIIHWQTPNKGGNNTSGFTALPSGIRYFEGTFASATSFTGIWSSTPSSQNNEWFIELYYGDAGLKMDHKNRNYGFSVRCLKN